MAQDETWEQNRRNAPLQHVATNTSYLSLSSWKWILQCVFILFIYIYIHAVCKPPLQNEPFVSGWRGQLRLNIINLLQLWRRMWGTPPIWRCGRAFWPVVKSCFWRLAKQITHFNPRLSAHTPRWAFSVLASSGHGFLSSVAKNEAHTHHTRVSVFLRGIICIYISTEFKVLVVFEPGWPSIISASWVTPCHSSAPPEASRPCPASPGLQTQELHGAPEKNDYSTHHCSPNDRTWLLQVGALRLKKP